LAHVEVLVSNGDRVGSDLLVPKNDYGPDPIPWTG
jgi:hypothetical protein